MNDVTIPADVAKAHAADIRRRWSSVDPIQALADLLDPCPPSLREQVAEALRWEPQVDAVLAVVADWLAAQPLGTYGPSDTLRHQRAADVALIRGGGA